MSKLLPCSILIAGCFFLFNSCKSISTDDKERYDVLSADTLSYNYFSIDTTDASCLKSNSFCPNARISYPIFMSPDSVLNNYLNEEIRKAVRYKSDTSLYTSVQDYIISYFKEHAEFKKQEPDDNVSSGWNIENAVSVYSKIGKHITLKIYREIYEGGAHPNSSVEYKTYDLIQLKILNANELLNLQDTALLSIGEKYYRLNNGISDSSLLEDKAFFIFGDEEDFEDSQAYGKFRFTTNFALTKDGVEFQYNSYEIGPYAVGRPSLTIPYNEIQSYLKVKVW